MHHPQLLPSHLPGSHKIVQELKREQNSTYNCLLSILDDSRFVKEIASLYPTLPVVANLRCGLWYVPDARHTCYFKSTDGHEGKWSFSTTRLNLDVAQLCHVHGGCIIVDATRRGKTFPVCLQRSTLLQVTLPARVRSPSWSLQECQTFARISATFVHVQDALSKTIPMWACVLNRTIAEQRARRKLGGTSPDVARSVAPISADMDDWDANFHAPLFVSATERASICERVPRMVQQLQATYPQGLPDALLALQKPLRPLWLSQQSHIVANRVAQPDELPFHPVILLSASCPAQYWRRPSRLPVCVPAPLPCLQASEASDDASSNSSDTAVLDDGASDGDMICRGSYMCACSVGDVPALAQRRRHACAHTLCFSQ